MLIQDMRVVRVGFIYASMSKSGIPAARVPNKIPIPGIMWYPE